MSSYNAGRKTVDFRDMYKKDDDEESSCMKSLQTVRCEKKRAVKCVTSLVPSYRIMKKYQWKTDLIKDLICGITLGIMQLPQGNFRICHCPKSKQNISLLYDDK